METKNGWKAMREAGAETPSPSCSSTQTALPTHSVMVSGTVEATVAAPLALRITLINNFTGDYKCICYIIIYSAYLVILYIAHLDGM